VRERAGRGEGNSSHFLAHTHKTRQMTCFKSCWPDVCASVLVYCSELQCVARGAVCCNILQPMFAQVSSCIAVYFSILHVV